MASSSRALVSLGFVLWSCGEPQEQPNRPFRAWIVASDDGQYLAQEVQYETLENVAQISGRFGYLKGHASLNLDEDLREIVSSANPDSIYADRGRTVRADYLVRNGVIVPQNFQTMEMLGLYYNIERTTLYWANNLGLPIQEIGHPSLFYNPTLSSTQAGVAREVTTVMNAAYLSGVRDLWFFKTSPQERIPVKMNLGVVAHEFGHFVFDYRFANFDPQTYETRFVANRFLLSGINEGLADFFSYMVTGSGREFAASLPELESERSLPVAWTLRSLPFADCRSGFYCEGSILASMLYEIAQTPGQSALQVGQLVYDALPRFREAWLRQRNQEILDPTIFLVRLLETAGVNAPIYCQFAAKWYDVEVIQRRLPCS